MAASKVSRSAASSASGATSTPRAASEVTPASRMPQGYRQRAVTPALAYMAQVNADIRRSRQAQAARI